MRGRYRRDANTVSWTGGLEIRYDALPAAVGLEPVLCLPDGREIQASGIGQCPYDRAGGAGRFTVTSLTFALSEAGSYTGTVELRPSPEVAYQDPAIKTIWDGTLAYPVSFMVYAGADIPH